jgi:DNA modification methylase
MSRGNTSGYKHPTQKPVELIEKAILNSSKSEDLVIDLFGGSGSTLLACEKTKRKSNLMDLDPKYCDVIIKRWEDFTGQTAKLLERGTDTNSLKEEEQWQDQKNTKLTQKKLLN